MTTGHVAFCHTIILDLREVMSLCRNGCLCCSVKDNGVAAIENLMKKRGEFAQTTWLKFKCTCHTSSGKFDYILLETTGLADPAPVAAMFWLDEELGAQVGPRFPLLESKL